MVSLLCGGGNGNENGNEKNPSPFLSAVVSDAAWCPTHACVLAAVTTEGWLEIWDVTCAHTPAAAVRIATGTAVPRGADAASSRHGSGSGAVVWSASSPVVCAAASDGSIAVYAVKVDVRPTDLYHWCDPPVVPLIAARVHARAGVGEEGGDDSDATRSGVGGVGHGHTQTVTRR